MLIEPESIINDFCEAAANLNLPGWPATFRGELLRAPHKQQGPPLGFGAVYAFALSRSAVGEAGTGMVLKVGRVGPSSDARFRSQHYVAGAKAAGSSLAKSLVKHRIVWPWLGIENLTEQNVKAWMLANLDRMNIYAPASSSAILPSLEMYSRARMGSVFEGSA